MDVEEAPLTELEKNKGSKTTIFAVVLASVIVLIFGIISLSTPTWVVSADVQVGLWKLCYEGSCQQLTDVLPYLTTVRGFLVISVCASSILAFFAFILMFFPKRENLVLQVGVLLFTIAAISSIVAASVFTAEYPMKVGLSFGYSYILVWVGGIVSFISGAASLMSSMKHS